MGPHKNARVCIVVCAIGCHAFDCLSCNDLRSPLVVCSETGFVLLNTASLHCQGSKIPDDMGLNPSLHPSFCAA